MIIAFSAGKTKLAPVLYKLRNIDMCYIIFPNNSSHFLSILEHEKPDYVLGIGVYSGIDNDKLRIETKCTNKFRNNFIDSENFQELTMPYFLDSNENFKLANGIGNSYCNIICYKITKFILENNLKTKFTFLHVPKKWNSNKTVDMIDLNILIKKL